MRYTELDALRGIAALMVVFFHYSVRYGQIYGYPVDTVFHFNIGQYGVQLFFIISGFVIFLTLDKTSFAVDFLVSRFSRLYPAYWIAITLTFLIVTIFSLPGREVSIKIAIINLTMFQKWLGVADVDGVYWTLAVELSFYFIMFLLFTTKQINRIDFISFFWLVIIIGCGFLEKNDIIRIHWAIKLLFLLEYGNLFIAGIMFFRITRTKNLLNYFILLISLVTEYYLHGKLAILIGVYFLIFFLFSNNKMKILTIKPLVFLGTISYSLYLTHQNIGYVIINGLRQFGVLNSFSVIAVPLIVSILIATLMQLYIEKPSLVFARRIWKESHLRNYLTSAYTRTK